MSKVDGGQWISLQMNELMKTTHQLTDVVSDRSELNIDEILELSFRNYLICDALDHALMHIFSVSTLIEKQVTAWLKKNYPDYFNKYEQRIKEYTGNKETVEQIMDHYNGIRFDEKTGGYEIKDEENGIYMKFDKDGNELKDE